MGFTKATLDPRRIIITPIISPVPPEASSTFTKPPLGRKETSLDSFESALGPAGTYKERPNKNERPAHNRDAMMDVRVLVETTITSSSGRGLHHVINVVITVRGVVIGK